jgi:hypothetical protein
LLFFTGIAREKLFTFYPENTYLFVCSVTVHGVTINIATPQTFSIEIVNKHILPQTVIFRTTYCSLYCMRRNCSNIVISLNKLMGVYCVDLVTPETYLHHGQNWYCLCIRLICWKTEYEDVSGITFVICGVTSCKLFHKKDKWHHWNKLYYIWIKLTLIAMYKSSFIQIKWEKIQLWKLVCFIMQLKWYSTTTFPNIMRKNKTPKKIS